MRYCYYAVAHRADPHDFLFLTSFLDLGTMTCCLPTGKEGFVDTTNYVFKFLTPSEYETHVELGAMEVRDSDIFVVAKEDYNWSTDER